MMVLGTAVKTWLPHFPQKWRFPDGEGPAEEEGGAARMLLLLQLCCCRFLIRNGWHMVMDGVSVRSEMDHALCALNSANDRASSPVKGSFCFR